MPHDVEGNLWPLMLSELIAAAQAALAEHGDMPIWMAASVLGYDDTHHYSLPIGYPPRVEARGDWRNQMGWWSDRGYTKAYVISGSQTG